MGNRFHHDFKLQAKLLWNKWLCHLAPPPFAWRPWPLPTSVDKKEIPRTTWLIQSICGPSFPLLLQGTLTDTFNTGHPLGNWEVVSGLFTVTARKEAGGVDLH